MGLSLFVRKNSKLHSLLPKHTFDKDVFTEGCDFCELGKEMAKYVDPELLDRTSKISKFTREMCKKGEHKGLCHFTFLVYRATGCTSLPIMSTIVLKKKTTHSKKLKRF